MGPYMTCSLLQEKGKFWLNKRVHPQVWFAYPIHVAATQMLMDGNFWRKLLHLQEKILKNRFQPLFYFGSYGGVLLACNLTGPRLFVFLFSFILFVLYTCSLIDTILDAILLQIHSSRLQLVIIAQHYPVLIVVDYPLK